MRDAPDIESSGQRASDHEVREVASDPGLGGVAAQNPLAAIVLFVVWWPFSRILAAAFRRSTVLGTVVLLSFASLVGVLVTMASLRFGG